MRIRKEQMDALRRLSGGEPRTHIEKRLRTLGVDVRLDAPTGDLLLRQPHFGTSRIHFDRDGRAHSMRGFDGRLTRFSYDETGRLSSVADQAGNATRYEFDEFLRTTAVTAATGFREEYVYSAEGPTEIRRGGSAAIQLDYDRTGNLAAIHNTDQRNALRFEYDADGRPRRMVDRTGAATTFSMDAEDRPLEIVAPSTARWSFAYDDEQSRTSIAFPDGRHEHFDFRDGLWVRHVRRDDVSVDLQYGADQRLVGLRDSAGQTIGAAYDDAGNLTAIDNGSHPVAFEYDSDGRRTSETVDGRRVEARYSPEGLLTAFVTHRGEKITFGRGADERINSITGWSQRTFGIGHDSRGQLASIAFPNGARWTRAFGASGLPSFDQLQHDSIRITRGYSFAKNGLLQSVDDSALGTKRHKWDAEDRLIGVDSPHQRVSYQFDLHGNPARISNRAYRYNLLDQIVDSYGVRARYDAAGNLVEWGEPSALTRLTFDARNQLIRVESPRGVAEYEYDGLGRRIVKRFGGATTVYTWWGEDLIAEDTDSPSPHHVDYLLLPGTHVPLAMRVNGVSYYYEVDHLDTPIRLLDEHGRVVWHGEPHGFDFTILVDGVAQPLRFPGQYYDEESGLFYNGTRYYHPPTGRYISADPLLFADGTNLYVYARNNPVSLADPSGQIAPLLAAALFVGGAVVVGAAVGALFSVAHRAVSNAVQGAPLSTGLWDAAKAGVKSGAVGGLGFGVGALLGGPVGAVVGAIALPALLAAGEAAVKGKLIVECAAAAGDALPIYGSIQRYRRGYGPDVPHPARQLAVDLAFDVIGLALLGLGAKAMKGRTGGWTTPYEPGSPTAGRTGKAVIESKSAALDRLYGKAEEPVSPIYADGIKPWEKDSSGRPLENNTLQTSDQGEAIKLKPGKEYIWVIDEDGTLRVGEEVEVGKEPSGKPRKLGHPTLTEGGKGRIGGELRYDPASGKWNVNDGSGRYTAGYPDRGPTQLNNAADLMRNSGIDVGNVEPRK